MGTVEFKINGAVVSVIYFRNLGEVDYGADDDADRTERHKYAYSLFRLEHTTKLITGEVWHVRETGIEALTEKILAQARGREG